jgi:hypothetical protein
LIGLLVVLSLLVVLHGSLGLGGCVLWLLLVETCRRCRHVRRRRSALAAVVAVHPSPSPRSSPSMLSDAVAATTCRRRRRLFAARRRLSVPLIRCRPYTCWCPLIPPDGGGAVSGQLWAPAEQILPPGQGPGRKRTGQIMGVKKVGFGF